MGADALPRLTTAQASARLGVKPATLYAYVSRGLIASERAERGGSTFDAVDVEVLAASRTPRSDRSADPRPQPANQGTPLMVLESDLTSVRPDELHFRGVAAADLARRAGFEQAATFLWTGELPPRRGALGFETVAVPADRAGDAAARLGPAASAVDRLIVAVLVAASTDPLRHELTAEAVQAAGRRMIACAVDALPVVGGAPTGTSIAARLWPALTAEPPEQVDLDLLDAALVLGMDHDLAVSTLAARVAASARSDPYAGVIAALSAFDGPLHGAASGAAFTMLTEVLQDGSPELALAKQVRAGHGTPGFGHLIYRRHDPRAEALFERMRGLPRYAPAVRAVDAVTATVQQRLPRPANMDLALAAMATARGMHGEAGQLIFAVSRMAGWVAHILDEYGQTPLRLRPQSRYVGVDPEAAESTARGSIS